MYDIFKKLLADNNVKAVDVAKATGIATSTLTDWKKGRSVPKTDKLKKIAEYFNVSVEYLLGISGPEYEEGKDDMRLMLKIKKLNGANRTLLESMIDTMLMNQD